MAARYSGGRRSLNGPVKLTNNLENRRGSDVTVGSNPTPTAQVKRPLTWPSGWGPLAFRRPVAARCSP
jgi:hypothetical protein